jgi:tetratricopeptide (TPR) repeat protein
MPESFPFAARLINALLAYERYLVMFFHPTNLAVFYPLNFNGYLDFQDCLYAVPALLVLIVLSAFALVLIRKKPQLAIGWCWFLGTMVPVIGFMQVGGQSHADRYLYIPMLGLAFIFPVLFEMLGSLRIWVRNILISVSLTVLGTSMLLATQIQVSYWKDGVTLCLHSLDVTGFCFNSVLSLCQSYSRTERFDEFFRFIDSKISLVKNPLYKAMMVTMKANVLYNTGKYQAAEETAESAADVAYTNKTKYTLIALCSYELGHIEKAGQYLVKAKTAQEPHNGKSLLSLPLNPALDWLELQLNERSRPQVKRKAIK